MARTKKGTPPTYREHKASGQARVRIHGRDYYLGKYGSPESREQYARIIEQWTQQRDVEPIVPRPDLTMAELILAYVERHVKNHYVKNGRYTSEVFVITSALKPLIGLHKNTLVSEFGPLKLQEVRLAMIRLGWARRTINAQISRIRSMFKWGVSCELVEESTWRALTTVQGLSAGRQVEGLTPADPEPVGPVDDRTVDLTVIELPRVLADMVRLQRLTAMRPEEICSLRPTDVNRNGQIWVYTPESHKTEHRVGKGRRKIPIGPRAQIILQAYMSRPAMSPCFSPIEAMRERQAGAASPRRPDQELPTPRTARRVREAYDPASYRRAIHRATDLANRKAVKAAIAAGFKVEGRIVPRWSPNQLRHTAATEIAEKFGIEAAQVTLGHEHFDTTQIYAEKSLMKAKEVAAKIG